MSPWGQFFMSPDTGDASARRTCYKYSASCGPGRRCANRRLGVALECAQVDITARRVEVAGWLVLLVGYFERLAGMWTGGVREGNWACARVTFCAPLWCLHKTGAARGPLRSLCHLRPSHCTARRDQPRRLHFGQRPRQEAHALYPPVQQGSQAPEVEVRRSVTTTPPILLIRWTS